jgi:signal peptidase I
MAQSFKVRSDAMKPRLPKGAELKIDKFNYKPKRWDVVVFAVDSSDIKFLPSLVEVKNPGGDSENDTIQLRPSFFFCKRILALPGESVQFRDSGISVNGKELKLPKELASNHGEFSGSRKYGFGAKEYKVPDGMLFVISDNTVAGKDSRHFGPIPLACVHGRVS